MQATRLTLPIAAVWTILIAVIMTVGVYYGTINAEDGKIADVKQTVAVHETRLNSVDATLGSQDARMTRIESKIDALLNRQGINPLKYQ